MRQHLKPTSLLMAIVVLAISVPGKPVLGAMIDTSSVMAASRAQAIRSNLMHLLTRQELQDRLAACGISPLLAARYIDGLSDLEIQDISASIVNLPSGGSGGAWGLVGIALVVTFLILLTTDLLGYTEVFNIR
jgi:hypothetical protein